MSNLVFASGYASVWQRIAVRVFLSSLLGLLFFTTPVVAQGTGITKEVLTISTVERPPFTFYQEGKVTSGFSYDLWKEIAKRLNLNYQFVEADSFGDMLAELKEHKADIAIANISIIAEREKYLDFSQPIYDSGIRILTRNESSSVSVLKLIWGSGVIQLIGAATAILLLVAHLMWWLEGGGHPYFRKAYPGGVWDAFWWAFIIVTMGGFERERPEKVWSRVFAIFWIILGLFFISTFTAKITTALTIGGLTYSINDWRDLKGKKVGVAKGTTMEKFAKKKDLRYIAYKDFTESLQALEQKNVEAILADAPVAEYHAHHKSKGEIVVVGDTFAPDKIGIAFQQDSPLRESVDRTLLGMFEDGTYLALKHKYFGE